MFEGIYNFYFSSNFGAFSPLLILKELHISSISYGFASNILLQYNRCRRKPL